MRNRLHLFSNLLKITLLFFCKSENAHQFGMMLFRKQAPMKSRFTILAALLLVNAIAYQVNDKLSFTPPFDAFDSQGLF